MRSFGRLLGIALLVAVASTLGACASGGSSDAGGEEEVRRFDNWRALFRHYTPRAQLRGECVANIGRGVTGSGGARPPVIEIDGQRTYDGCPPPSYEPEDIVRVEMIDASEAGMILGSRGAGGMIRMYTSE
ncbi:MAG: hypothetical protein R3326_05115 [Gemmatimonadota bacterium]|nr:hypothetical protein [Gemmatimonadota bacterium]